jgi:TfoX/Sxy family transcriptional regulator of competence genes
VAPERSPQPLVERFGRVLDRHPDVARRQMFGYPAAFVGGNLVTSLHRTDWVVRVPAADRDAALASGAGPFEPMAGRPMNGFVTLPADDRDDDDRAAAWVERAIAHGRTLPPKKP